MAAVPAPYLLFLGDAPDALAAKMATACVHWRPERCLGQLRWPGCAVDLGIPDLTVAEAAERGARSLVLARVASGGALEAAWLPVVEEALCHGLDVVNGMHQRLADDPRVAAAARAAGRRIFDLRHTTLRLPTGTGVRRSGRRLLTVGTDCSCGKMFTALALEREMRARGMDVQFRATGQTGILVAGEGIAVDAVVADFVAGAAERLAPAAPADHWDVVEGQGSLFHPAFAGVSLGLLHGAQPDVLVLCHEPTRRHLRGLPGSPVPDLLECLAANLAAARLTSPAVRCVGISMDTSRLPEPQARAALAEAAARSGLPAVDPVRDGVARLVERLA